ncbi:hypothetical protein BACCELL_00835 [Bacteroides cellulosilyticus DSM 14838]|uniref:Uncharacterized protein n=1 Tax=Bacteroides cellulosilyticus DSM 14838 TaxID=537012 RepID=E2N990_9BACE|nr:hypothetical protein BACCELL_00835 [Bacteroides cellulosilyticus DSM 14838]
MRHRSIAQPLVPLSTRQLVSFLSISKGNKGILRLYGLKKVNCYKLFMQT